MSVHGIKSTGEKSITIKGNDGIPVSDAEEEGSKEGVGIDPKMYFFGANLLLFELMDVLHFLNHHNSHK